ncbi:hypothetical protein D9757_003648 [Collybiopsis confluens]|uniref:LIM zinc-binding domain-containing protein n=1 Tax=Collybiopsis confluens TaxID=2823264 RepID=A0A8H5HUR1_9AGAR|nr:hypothetical protein D9757_003648 [Collybiopsis confluens]
MLVSTSNPSHGGPPRISQLLPTVKCSNCNQPVPLNDLVDHVCSAAPPVPSLPTNSGGGLRGRFQGLLTTPAAKPPPAHPIPSPPPSPSRPASPTSPSKASPSDQPRRPSFASSKAGSPPGFQPRSSPLVNFFSDESKDYFSSQQNNSSSSSSVPGPSTSLHAPGKASVSSFRSAMSGQSGSSSGRDTNRDTVVSNSSYGNRDTVSPVGANRPSFVSSPKPHSSSSTSWNVPPKSPSSPALPTQRSPTVSSPLSAPKSPTLPQISPVSPRVPESRTVSSLATLSTPAMASSSSAPAALNSPQAVIPPFSTLGRRPDPISTSRGAVSIPTGSMSALVPPSSGQPFRGPVPPHHASASFSSWSPGIPGRIMTPSIHHEEPDTKIGGEAGMAGVGRRGFAAAARAAFFAHNMGASIGTDNRGPFLDIDAAVRITNTPPLTTTSISPQSAGPVSPAFPFSTSPTSMSHSSSVDNGGFFDKVRIRTPGLGPDSENESAPMDNTLATRAGGFAIPPRSVPTRQKSEDSNTSSSSSALGLAYDRSTTSDSSSRRRAQNSMSGVIEDGSDSECGLAYADSDTDDEYHNQNSRLTIMSDRSKGLRDSRSGATPTPGRRNLGVSPAERPVSSSVYSDDEDEDGGDDDLMHRLELDSSPPSQLYRADSNASVSSSSSAAAIAKALGLSASGNERVPGGYSSLGGPGAPGVARTLSNRSLERAGRNRSATVSTVRSVASDPAGRVRSHTISRADYNQSAMEHAVSPTSPSWPVSVGLRDDGPMSSASRPHHDSSSSSIRGSKMAHRSNTVGVTAPYTIRADAAEKMPKLPARSKTERMSNALHTSDHHKHSSASSSASGFGKKKVKVCVRCDKKVEDGRWISVESPGEAALAERNAEKVEQKNKGVLCERCWKNMYLPKCRRCSLPIEKQAVSSSDGQLKGKYHKDCFNCFTCHKPFPDKIFYVYDGRPLCKYHYHETNESLCAAATCGQPIEGACIVSHAGDKYHPEHLTCEWTGHPKCQERLNGEYWELDGRMLCENHANSGETGEEWEDDRWNTDERRASRAMKRMTRFVDLGTLGDLR